MSGNIDNKLLDGYKNTIMTDEYFESKLNSDITTQKSDLITLFTNVNSNNVTSAQKSALETRATQLHDKIDGYQAKMAELKEQIAENQEKVKAISEEITNMITDAENKSEQMISNQKAYVAQAIDDVFYMYQHGTIKQGQMMPEIYTRIQKSPFNGDDVQKILDKLTSKQSEIQPLVDQASSYMQSMSNLENQYGATSSAYKVIQRNLQQIANTGTSYTNSDYDSNVPIYSIQKTNDVSEWFADTKINVDAKNTNYDKNSVAPNKQSIDDKYGDLYSPKGSVTIDGDAYNATKNPAIANLGKAIDNGLLTDLLQSGFDKEQVAEFLVNNFGAAKLEFGDDGKLKIPYGHGDSGAKGIFGKVSDFFNSPSLLGAKDTWTEGAGNTIDSNPQMKALSENYEKIFNKMSADGFTFKEAMYALFDKNNGLFKDCGINFNLGDLSNGEPTYSINLAGDEKTAQFLEKLAGKVSDIWGVDALKSSNSERYDAEDDVEQQRTDPIGFQMGNTQFSFLYDANKDGVFSGTNEFAGASGDWFTQMSQFDADGNGIIEGDELDNVFLLGASYNDNAKTKTNDNGDLREETTNVDYSISSAKSLNISSIDLTQYKNGTKSTGDSKGEKDINGSELFNDSFVVNFNNDDPMQATRMDDTDAFMKAIYSDASGKSFQVGLNNDDATKIVNDEYAAAENIFTTGENAVDKEQYKADVSNLEALDGQITQLQSDFTAKKAEKQADTTTQLYRAENRVAALNNDHTWNSSMQADVMDAAQKAGLAVSADLLEQTKGMYEKGEASNATDLVNKYKELLEKEQKEENANKTENTNNTDNTNNAGIKEAEDKLVNIKNERPADVNSEQYAEWKTEYDKAYDELKNLDPENKELNNN